LKTCLGVASGVVLAVIVLEAILRSIFSLPNILDRTEGGRFEGAYFEEQYFKEDPELGYRLPSNTSADAKLMIAGLQVYDVVYSTDDNGLRFTDGNPDSKMSFAFLGCGMTFGEGLEDHQTLPSAFSHALDNQYHVINLAVNGYGPQHALRVIEAGRLTALSNENVAAVYYETSPDHMIRSYTPPLWDLVGPGYRLSSGGKDVEYTGQAYPTTVAKGINWMTANSIVYSGMRSHWQKRMQKDKESMMWLYLQIIKRSKYLVEQVLNAEYRVVFWDAPFVIDGENLTPHIIDFLKREGIETVLTSDIFGTDEFSDYQIRYDGHPNAYANTLIGNYLAEGWNEVL
jgi:hypothetical protein